MDKHKKNRVYGYIYKIVFPENSFNKVGCPFYIGQHKGDFDPYYWGSGSKVFSWLKKRGLNSKHCSENDLIKQNIFLKREVLCYCYSYEELNTKETESITPFLDNELCLNLVSGGNRFYATPELREKISKSTKDAMWRDDVREKYLKSLESRFDEETFEKMSIAAKENKNYIKMNIKNAEKHKKITSDPKRREERRKKKAEKTGIKVICIETGEMFDSINNAQQKLKVYHIKDVIDGKRRHAGGYHFYRI